MRPSVAGAASATAPGHLFCCRRCARRWPGCPRWCGGRSRPPPLAAVSAAAVACRRAGAQLDAGLRGDSFASADQPPRPPIVESNRRRRRSPCSFDGRPPGRPQPPREARRTCRRAGPVCAPAFSAACARRRDPDGCRGTLQQPHERRETRDDGAIVRGDCSREAEPRRRVHGRDQSTRAGQAGGAGTRRRPPRSRRLRVTPYPRGSRSPTRRAAADHVIRAASRQRARRPARLLAATGVLASATARCRSRRSRPSPNVGRRVQFECVVVSAGAGFELEGLRHPGGPAPGGVPRCSGAGLRILTIARRRAAPPRPMETRPAELGERLEGPPRRGGYGLPRSAVPCATDDVSVQPAARREGRRRRLASRAESVSSSRSPSSRPSAGRLRSRGHDGQRHDDQERFRAGARVGPDGVAAHGRR